MNLKKVLMELGNKLVLEKGFDPATGWAGSEKMQAGDSTFIIAAFTKWINEKPAVQEALAEMGVEWPMPSDKPYQELREKGLGLKELKERADNDRY